jgi:eukaryotic-like serine/threonine-protein kinase
MGKVFMITEGLENMGALRTGGQGSVYKGRRVGEIITAVKLLPTPIYTENKKDKNFRDFQNEVEKLKKVNEEPNPNVVKIMSSGITESGSFPFIEMEFIEGPDLEELLKPPHDPVFSVREVIKVADQLANALSHCHKVGVRHGDIKSNNVKFNVYTGNYVLLDFGLSIMSDEQRRTSLRRAGTIEFMAPEQNTGKILYETDIYSYGIILYELLAGTVPFPLENNGETDRNNVMVSHMEAPVPDVMAKRRENMPVNWSEAKKKREMQVPQWLLDVISKCLEKEPEKRYATGMELHDAVIQKSILAVEKNKNNADSATVLKTENERLRNLIMQYEEAKSSKERSNVTALDILERDETFPEKRSAVRISKPVFLTLILLITGLGVLAGYIFFSQRDSNYSVSGAVSDTLDIDSAAVTEKPLSLNVSTKPADNDISTSPANIDKEPAAANTDTPEPAVQKHGKSKKAEKKAHGRDKKSKGEKFIEIKFY